MRGLSKITTISEQTENCLQMRMRHKGEQTLEYGQKCKLGTHLIESEFPVPITKLY